MTPYFFWHYYFYSPGKYGHEKFKGDLFVMQHAFLILFGCQPSSLTMVTF